MTAARILWRLMRREIGSHLANRRLRVLAGIVLLLTPLSVYASVQQARTREGTYEKDVRQRATDRQQRPPIGGYQLEPALRVLRPPAPAAVFVRGLDGALPTAWDMAPEGEREGRSAEDLTGPQPARLAFDLEFLIRTLLGLLAIILGIEAFAGERAAGTVRALLAQPLPRWTIIVAKLLAGSTTLAIVLAAVLLVAGLSTRVYAREIFQQGYLIALPGLAAPAVCYLSVLFAAGVVASELVESGQSALAAATIVWLGWALVLMPVSALIGASAVPVKAATQLEEERAALYQRRNLEAQTRLGDELRRIIGPIDLRHLDYTGDRGARVEAAWTNEIRAIRADLNKIDEQAGRTRIRQQDLRRWLAILNPADEFSSAAADMAGTGGAEARRWDVFVQRYVHELQAALFDESRPRIHLLVPDVPGERPMNLAYYDRRPMPRADQLPDFTPPAAALAERIDDAHRALIVLLLQGAALWGGAIWLFRRGLERW